MPDLNTAINRFLVGPRIEAALNQILASVCGSRVVVDEASFGRHGALRLVKQPDGAVRMFCSLAAARARESVGTVLSQRSAVLICLFARTVDEIAECEASVGDDGDDLAGVVCFCSRHADAILVPDSDFFGSGGYGQARALGAAPPVPWRQRSDVLIWRGSTTGLGAITAPAMVAADGALTLRTRACLALRDVPGCDVKFSSVVQTSDRQGDEARLRAAGLLGGRVGTGQWVRHKFALDMDGNTNAWSNLFERLLLGCCVIKVASPLGFRQWYYDDLVPWRHFVPVVADLSDLVATLAWCRAHPAECEAIAAEGSALAHRMTFQGEMTRGLATLNRRLRGKPRLPG